MKLIKKISIIAILLVVVLSSKAQDTLRIAANGRMPFSVDILNTVSGSDYYFDWNLEWKETSTVWTPVGVDKDGMGSVDSKTGNVKSKIDYIFNTSINAYPNHIFRLSVNASRVAPNNNIMCSSADSLLYIKIIDKPILEFDETEYGMYCSPSESTTKDQIDFKVNLTGYWGDWKVHYVIYEETREGIKEISDAWFTVTDNNFGEFSIILDDDRFRNTDKWDKTYHVRLEEFEYMPNPETNGVADPDLKDSLGDLFETQIAKFTVKPLVVIGKRKISFKEIKNNN